MSATDIDLTLLPAPNIIETLDFETIFAQQKADLVGIYPECAPMLALESEPLVKQLRITSYRELLLRQRINEACRALLLPLAKGADLDHIGVTYHRTERLKISAGNPAAIPPIPAVWESDEDYLYRCLLAPSGFSIAGPSGAYEYHALSASGDVKNASPHSPAPGSVDVYILSRIGDGTPSAGLLATVDAVLQPRTVRPMCDEVKAKAATIKPYQINATIYTYDGADSGLALSAATQKITAYKDAMHHCGYSIFVNGGIKAELKVSGVSEIEVISPAADIINGVGEAAYCTGINIVHGGVKQ